MPQLNDQNVNGFYSNLNGNHLPKNERISLNQQFYNTHSPSATLTPGRKSASPHFFHSNDSTFMKNNEQSHRHFNTIYHHTPNSHIHNHNINYNQAINLNNSSNHHNHLSLVNQSSNNIGYQFGGSFNHESYNLKLPTTPTRSKSLSPSLRCVIQPPKLRYKQENTINSEKKDSADKNGVKDSIQNSPFQSNNGKEFLKDRIDSSTKKDLSISPYLFEPISISKSKSSIDDTKTPKKDNFEVKINKSSNDLEKKSATNSAIKKTELSTINKDNVISTILEPCNKTSNNIIDKMVLLKATSPKGAQIEEKTDSSLKDFVNNLIFKCFIY